MELVALVDSPECVSAAVQNGADAVCAALRVTGRPGLSLEDFYGAAKFCRVRGVRLYAELDLIPTDAVFTELVSAARSAWLNGADAIRVSDPGLMLALRQSVPDAPLQLGSLFCLQLSDGIKLARAMGARRAALAPQLAAEDIAAVISASELEAEVPVHGWLSPSWPGRLLLTALARDGSELRGGDWRESLDNYRFGVKGATPLVLPDLCLLPHVRRLADMGVAAVSVDGRSRRPEYAAQLCSLYSRAVAGVKLDTGEELAALQRVYPAKGYTDGYFTGKGRPDAVKYDVKPADDGSAVLQELRKSYLRREFQRVPVRFTAEVALGSPIRLIGEDDRGNSAQAEGGKVGVAFHREFALTELQTELYKTGGTPFLCEGVKASIQKGVSVEPRYIAELRDSILAELMEKRLFLEERRALEVAPFPKADNTDVQPLLTVSVTRASQLTPRLLELSPPIVYVPIEEIKPAEDKVLPFIGREGVTVVAALPGVFTDRDKPKLASMLMDVRQLGIDEVLCENLGHAVFARDMGFKVRGGIGLGILSSPTLEVLRHMSFRSVTLSPELSSREAAEISKHVPAELIVYGRLPVALSEATLNAAPGERLDFLPDKEGIAMPTVRGFGGRVTLLGSKKLFLALRSREYMNSGLWGVRLSFTTEHEGEVNSIVERYLYLGAYQPADYTRGLY